MSKSWLEDAERFFAENRPREALAAIGRALKSQGPSPALFMLRGRIHNRNGRYQLALRDLGRAIALAPSDAELRLQRASLLSVAGDFRAARRDAALAVRMNPRDESARLSLIRLMIREGRLTEASRAIAALSRASGEADLCRGLQDLKAGHAADAAARFRRLLDDPDGNLAQRARFYWLVAKAVSLRVRAAARPMLSFCGLGLFPPYSATLEVLAELPGCDTFVNNISEVETRELLDVLGPGVRCVTYRDGGNDMFVLRTVFRELDRGRKVAFVTRGHPMVYGTLGRLLVERCRESSTPFRIFGAVSSIDTLLDRAGAALAAPASAIQAFDGETASRARLLDASSPLIVSFNRQVMRKTGVGRLQSTLRRFYPKEHACWMFGPRYDGEPRTVALSRLSADYPEIGTSLMLYIPAVGTVRP